MNLKLTRNQLAAFLKDPESIKQFEQLFKAADTLEIMASEALVASDAAQNSASESLSLIQSLAQDTEQSTVYCDLAEVEKLIQDATLSAPEQELGTIAAQNADNVLITGGNITKLDNPLPVDSGGTGQTVFSDGQLLIGNSTGSTLTKSSLTAGANISIVAGAGTITIAVFGLGTMAFKNVGISGTAVLAKITGLGANGSLTFTDGIITGYTAPT